MRVILISMMALAGVTFGCSKKTASAPPAAEASETGGVAVAPTQDNPMLAGELEDLNRKIQQQQYDAAVGALVGMAQIPKSDKQEAAFNARLRETETALLKKAQQGDVAAQQSAQMLGRMMTGR